MCPSMGTLVNALAGELVNVAHAHLMWCSNSTCTAFLKVIELPRCWFHLLAEGSLDVHYLDCHRVASAAL